MKLSVIIASYNTKNFLKSALESVLREITKANIPAEVIVVDNASTDGSSEMVKKEFPNVKFIQNKQNLGFSKANNIGVKKSMGEYILFLNPDVVIPNQEKNILLHMLQFMEKNKKVGAATCRVNLFNNKLDDACHRGFPTPWNALCHFSGLSQIFPSSRIFSGYSMGWKNLSEIHEIDTCAGAFMLVRRTAGQGVGWWDEDYFWYGEDIDFCFRLKKSGWKIYFLPDVWVLHHKGVSGGIQKISKNITTATKETKLIATRARFHAMKIFYKKHYEHIYPKILTWLVLRGITIKEKLASF